MKRLSLILLFLLISTNCLAWTDTEIVNAIYKAENSVAYPYGIKSLKYEDRTDKSLSKHDWARMICFNTVRNQRKRHAAHNCNKTFLECLRDRYCPVNEHELNQYWLDNVKWFLNNEGGVK